MILAALRTNGIVRAFKTSRTRIESRCLGLYKQTGGRIYCLPPAPSGSASWVPVYGSWMLEELGRHGHGVYYGTLYPALHRMEEDGLLEWEDRVEGGRAGK